VAAVKAERDEARNEIVMHVDKIARLTRKIENLEADLSGEQQQLTALRWEHQQLGDELLKAQNRIDELETSLAQVEKVRDSLLAEKSRLEVVVFDETERRQAADAKVTVLTEEKEHLMAVEKQQKQQIMELKSSCAAAHKKAAKLQKSAEENYRLTVKLKESNEIALERAKKFETEAVQLRREKPPLELQIQTLQTVNAKLTAAKQQHSVEIDAIASERNFVERRLQTLIPTAQILEHQYHEEKQRVEAYQEQARLTDSMLWEEKQSNATLTLQREELTKRAETAERLLEETRIAMDKEIKA
jgi:hypothetical protein